MTFSMILMTALARSVPSPPACVRNATVGPTNDVFYILVSAHDILNDFDDSASKIISSPHTCGLTSHCTIPSLFYGVMCCEVINIQLSGIKKAADIGLWAGYNILQAKVGDDSIFESRFVCIFRSLVSCEKFHVFF